MQTNARRRHAGRGGAGGGYIEEEAVKYCNIRYISGSCRKWCDDRRLVVNGCSSSTIKIDCDSFLPRRRGVDARAQVHELIGIHRPFPRN